MGKLAEIKTKPTTVSVLDFINGIADEQKRTDSLIVLKLMEKAMKLKHQYFQWPEQTRKLLQDI